jgi:hypothetical protein
MTKVDVADFSVNCKYLHEPPCSPAIQQTFVERS